MTTDVKKALEEIEKLLLVDDDVVLTKEEVLEKIEKTIAAIDKLKALYQTMGVGK